MDKFGKKLKKLYEAKVMRVIPKYTTREIMDALDINNRSSLYNYLRKYGIKKNRT